MSPDDRQKEEPPRRWPRFGLWSILVVTTFAAIVAAAATGAFGVAVASITSGLVTAALVLAPGVVFGFVILVVVFLLAKNNVPRN
jgi:purine-cytosine permease-like protein